MPPLNEQQQAFVDAINGTNENINLIARAGCGKTYALVNGAVRTIIENRLGTAALMAFNKSASVEFEQRIEALQKETGNVRFDEVETGTVHSFGFRAVRRAYGRVKVDGYKLSNIIKERHPEGFDFLPHVAKLVSLAKQFVFDENATREEWTRLIEHFDIEANGNAEEIIAEAVAVLRASNKDRENIDFDDMIYLPVLNDWRVDQFDFVLIDEAQDTNTARRRLAFKMLNASGRLIAVGDDKQAIYGFTGADSDSLEIIKEARNSIELPLTITYRCPKAVVEEANRLVPDLTAHETAPEGKVRMISRFVERQ